MPFILQFVKFVSIKIGRTQNSSEVCSTVQIVCFSVTASANLSKHEFTVNRSQEERLYFWRTDSLSSWPALQRSTFQLGSVCLRNEFKQLFLTPWKERCIVVFSDRCYLSGTCPVWPCPALRRRHVSQSARKPSSAWCEAGFTIWQIAPATRPWHLWILQHYIQFVFNMKCKIRCSRIWDSGKCLGTFSSGDFT